MNKPDKTNEENNKIELEQDAQQNNSCDLEILSDCGDDFCECPEISFRPCSRDVHSEEEFQDAIAESSSKGNSTAEIPLKVSPFTKCDKFSKEESNIGLLLNTRKNDEATPTNTRGLPLIGKELQLLLGLQGGPGSEEKETLQATKRFKADRSRAVSNLRLPSFGITNKSRGGSFIQRCNSGRGDARTSIAERLRNSFSRIPVASGRRVMPMTRCSGSRGSEASQIFLTDHQPLNVDDQPLLTEPKPDKQLDAVLQENVSKPFESINQCLSFRDDDPCREDISLKNEVMENASSGNEKNRDLERNDVPSLELGPEITTATEQTDKEPCKESSEPVVASQGEVVVLTLAEERLRNKKIQEVEDRKETEFLKPGCRSAPRSAKRLLEDKTRIKGNASHRLSSMMREISGQAVVKQAQPLSRENSRSSAGKPLKPTSGRQSASSDLEKPGNRLQAIKQEKAQIRQRMSEAKPITPASVRKIMGTPTMKQPLMNPLMTSLKRDIASKQPLIERIAKSVEGGRNTGVTETAGKAVKACPISKEAERTHQTENDEEQSAMADTAASKAVKTPQLKQRSKILDRPISSRASRTAGDINAINTKAELCSLSAKYQARLKKYEAQKNDITKSQNELVKTVTALNQLRESILALAGDDPGELEVLQLVAERPASSNVHASSSMERIGVAESSTSITGNTLQGSNEASFEEKSELLLSQLETEKSELSQTTEILKKENDSLKKQERDRSERELALKKELLSLQNGLKGSEKRANDLEMKIAERDAAIAQLRGSIAKMQDQQEKLKQKDNQIVSLRRQFVEGSKEHNMQLKKALEAKEAIHQDLVKEREHFKNQITKLREENDFLKIKQEESSKMVLNFKEKNSELQIKIEKEMKKNHELETELMDREKYVINLERKLDDKETNSSSILGLSEQLMQKDSIISELEKHRAGAQSQNREMCALLSSAFHQLGQEIGAEEIESSLTGGRIKYLKAKLSQLISGKSISDIQNKKQESPNEYEKKILQLEDHVAVLQAELQESKNYSETLAGVITDSCPWNDNAENSVPTKQLGERDGSEGDHPIRLVRSRTASPCIVSTPPVTLTTPNNGHINEIRELFISLEGKRQALMRMERKVQELEEIHANCAQKRVRNEIRIDQLEMMLASYKI